MKYNNIWIVVPTYWGHRGTPYNPPCTQFDHPTSLEEKGTLGRTLESIMKQEGEFNVLLVAVGTHDNLFEQVHTIVRTIAKQHNQKKMCILCLILIIKE